MHQRRALVPRLVMASKFPKPLMVKIQEISDRSRKDAAALEQIADIVLTRLNGTPRPPPKD